MNISFDLDGVITDGNAHEHFSWIDHNVPAEKQWFARESFYKSCKLKLSPYMFLAEEDEGFAITCRKPESWAITTEWLEAHKIKLPIFYADGDGEIDWRDYAKASIIAAERKAAIIWKLNIQLHFDNNPYVVKRLRIILPVRKVVIVRTLL